MLLLLEISLKPLWSASPDWTDQTPMTLRSMAADCATPMAPDTLLQQPH